MNNKIPWFQLKKLRKLKESEVPAGQQEAQFS